MVPAPVFLPRWHPDAKLPESVREESRLKRLQCALALPTHCSSCAEIVLEKATNRKDD